MSAMKRAPGDDKRGKSSRPDGTPTNGRAGKGKTFGKTPSGPSHGYKSRDNSDGSSTSGDRPYKSRKPYEGKSEGSDKHHTYKGSRDGKPTQPWKKGEESDVPRERRYSDKPSGDRPFKTRKPFGEKGHDADKADRYKGARDEKTSRPWKRDDKSGTPHEKRYADKSAGDRPFKSRKPRESQDETYKPRVHSRPDETKPTRPRKPEDVSDAPRERRVRKSDAVEREPSRHRDDGEFRPKRKFQEKGEPGKYRDDKSYKPGKIKGNYGYDKDGSIRLNKFIANSGVCSRREADVLIESGAVSVNGKIVTELGTKITRDDKVQFGGETLSIEKKVYLLLNKPKGYITTVDDPQDRNTVMMLVKDACKERIYPVGRLDRNTSGLLLFTNDGETAKKLTHPGHKVRKVYHVELNKGLAKSDMIRLTEGIELEDGIMAVDEIAYTGSGDDKKNIGLVIHSGRNRIVRRLFEVLEYEVVKLDRVAFANLTKKDLPRGRWRMLEQSEINMLLMI
ncbi:MAG: RNA-binding S4 domain-containing protein [Lentimicrobium sp.]|nr:RNA-binding S4 domain-containing protein [Lentimicrobium sp.]